ncbi:substance-P receptor-like [Gigantopelta aegis]|uniref:substance-P receptor-like n=1 Tax=Gigantopelta aegis TaxID=1735272 RepID=UPI001B888C1C|nr:substance-P receptor-like [Gigantopelta aegis]
MNLSDVVTNSLSVLATQHTWRDNRSVLEYQTIVPSDIHMANPAVFENGTNQTNLTAASAAAAGVGNDTVGDQSMSVESKVVLIILYTFTTVAAITGNIIAIAIFARGKRSRTELRPFLMNLSVADLIVALICIPFTTTYQLMDEWVFSDPMCPLVQFIQTVSVTASVSTNMAIGIDRYFAVAHPLRKRFTSSKSKYVIVLIWSISFALSVVLLFVGKTNNDEGKTKCGETWPEPSKFWNKAYTLFLMCLTYFTPLLILCVTYSIVGRILSVRAMPGHSDEIRDAAQVKSKRKIVKMLITVVLMFGMCWLPIHLFFLLDAFAPNTVPHEHKEALYWGCHWLSMANSFVNPVIYGFMNDSFRADLKHIFYSLPCHSSSLTYRPGARRWKTSDNVRDISYSPALSEPKPVSFCLTQRDKDRLWQNGAHHSLPLRCYLQPHSLP